MYTVTSNYKTFDHTVTVYTNNKKGLWVFFFLKKSVYRYIMVNPLLKYATVYTLCMYTPGTQPEIFQGRGGFLKLRHFDKHFIKKSRKRARREKFWSFFYLRYSENYILNGKYNLRMDTIRAFFSKIRALVLIFKKGQGRPLFTFSKGYQIILIS